MKKALITLALILACVCMSAQNDVRSRIPQKTDVHAGRWEVIQSTIIRLNTFLFDKQRGDAYVLATTKTGEDVWELVLRESSLTDDKYKSIPGINYQLFFGGAMAKDAYMTNVHTGETWTLTENRKTKELFFERMKIYE